MTQKVEYAQHAKQDSLRSLITKERQIVIKIQQIVIWLAKTANV